MASREQNEEGRCEITRKNTTSLEQMTKCMKKGIFQLFFEFLQQQNSNNGKLIIAYILIVEIVHLTFFAHHPYVEFPYTGESENDILKTFNKITSLIFIYENASLEGFVSIFYCLIVILLGFMATFGLAIYWTYQKKSYAYWFQYLSKKALLLLSSILLLPILNILFWPLSCEYETDIVKHRVLSNELECWTSKHFVYSASGLIVALLFIFLLLLYQSFYVENRIMTSAISLNKFSASFDNKRLIIKSALVLCFNIMVDKQFWDLLSIIYFCGCLYIFYYSLQHNHYYNKIINQLYPSIYLVFIWNMIVVLCRLFIYDELNGLLLFACIPFIIFAYLCKEHNFQMEEMKNHHKICSIYQFERKLRLIKQLNMQKGNQRRKNIIMKTLLYFHHQKCETTVCPCRSIIKLLKFESKQECDAKIILNNFWKIILIEFDALKMKYSNSPVLHLLYLRHIMEDTKNYPVGILAANTALEFTTAYTEQFQFYRYKRLMDIEMESRKEEQNQLVSIGLAMKYKRIFSRYMKTIELATKYYYNFWSSIQSARPNMKNILSLGKDVLDFEHKLGILWDYLSKFSFNKAFLIRTYSSFYEKVFHDSERAEFYRSMDKVHGGMNIEGFEGTNIESYTGNGNGCIAISLKRTEVGKVTQCNNSFGKIVGYTKDEIIGEHMNKIMPQIFQNDHENMLENIALKCKIEEEAIEIDTKERTRYFLGKNKYIVAANLKIVAEASLLNGFQCFATVTTLRKDISCSVVHLLLSTSYEILFLTSTASSMLRLSPDIIANFSILLTTLLPAISNPAMNYLFFSKNGGTADYHFPDLTYIQTLFHIKENLKLKKREDSSYKIGNIEASEESVKLVLFLEDLVFKKKKIGYMGKLVQEYSHRSHSKNIKLLAPPDFQMRFDPDIGLYIRERPSDMQIIKQSTMLRRGMTQYYGIPDDLNSPHASRRKGDFTQDSSVIEQEGDLELQTIIQTANDNQSDFYKLILTKIKLLHRFKPDIGLGFYRTIHWQNDWSRNIITYQFNVNAGRGFLEGRSENIPKNENEFYGIHTKKNDERKKEEEIFSFLKTNVKTRNNLKKFIEELPLPFGATKFLWLSIITLFLLLSGSSIIIFLRFQSFDQLKPLVDYVHLTHSLIRNVGEFDYHIRDFTLIYEGWYNISLYAEGSKSDMAGFYEYNRDGIRGHLDNVNGIIKSLVEITASEELDNLWFEDSVLVEYTMLNHTKSKIIPLYQAITELMQSVHKIVNLNVWEYGNENQELRWFRKNYFNGIERAFFEKQIKLVEEFIKDQIQKENTTNLYSFVIIAIFSTLIILGLIPASYSGIHSVVKIMSMLLQIPKRTISPIKHDCIIFLDELKNTEANEIEDFSETESQSEDIGGSIIIRGETTIKKFRKSGQICDFSIRIVALYLLVSSFLVFSYVQPKIFFTEFDHLSEYAYTSGYTYLYLASLMNNLREYLYDPTISYRSEREIFQIVNEKLHLATQRAANLPLESMEIEDHLSSSNANTLHDLLYGDVCVLVGGGTWNCENFHSGIIIQGALITETEDISLLRYFFREANRNNTRIHHRHFFNDQQMIDSCVLMRDPVMDTFKAIQDLIKSELNDILENLPVILSICFVVYIFLEIFVFVLVWLPIPLKIRKQAILSNKLISLLPISIISTLKSYNDYFSKSIFRSSKKQINLPFGKISGSSNIIAHTYILKLI